MNFYVHDKLRELETERLANQLYVERPRPRRRLLVGGVVSFAGHVLRRAGEGLEGWGDVPYEHDHRLGERVTR
jgi:hypothetical protein